MVRTLALLIGLTLLAAPADEKGRLRSIKRICVERFSGIATHGTQASEVAFASLFSTKRFKVTENCDKADAVLKGAASETFSQRVRSEGDNSTVRRSGGGFSSDVGALFGSGTVSESERLYSSESQRHASVSMRLVDAEGEILWATNSDSDGNKAKAALVDAVERGIRQLLRDMEKPETPVGKNP